MVKKYISLDLSHTYFEEKFFRITPTVHVGYVINNDNINKKSGISNITSGLKFNFGKFFTTANWIYGPEPILFDTLDSNNQDGWTPSPGKKYGIHTLILDAIERSFARESAAYVKEQYTSQRIVKSLFYVSLGFEIKYQEV